MCGIMGYVGREAAWDIVVSGLRRLEYRGYDSAGMALMNGSVQIVGDTVRLWYTAYDGTQYRIGLAESSDAGAGPQGTARAHARANQRRMLR